MKHLAALALLCATSLAHGQDEDAPQPKESDHIAIPGVQPVVPGDMSHNPVMWIGVKACGDYVVWLVFDDHISVVDKTHRPKDFKEFLKALEQSKIPSDERVIACTAGVL